MQIFGGAISLGDNASVALTSCTFHTNTVRPSVWQAGFQSYGGAIHLYGYAKAILMSCLLSGNSAKVPIAHGSRMTLAYHIVGENSRSLPPINYSVPILYWLVTKQPKSQTLALWLPRATENGFVFID